MEPVPTDFPSKFCPVCKETKIRYIHFAPKGVCCRECQAKRAKVMAKKHGLGHYLPSPKGQRDHSRVTQHVRFGS